MVLRNDLHVGRQKKLNVFGASNSACVLTFYVLQNFVLLLFSCPPGSRRRDAYIFLPSTYYLVGWFRP